MLIIDATYGMEITYGEEELWLNPSNLLMMTQNIRNGLQEYMTNSYLEKEIDKKYEEIKVTLSELDANLKLTAENASRKKIVVNSDSLKYLEKYGFELRQQIVQMKLLVIKQSLVQLIVSKMVK